LENRRYSSLQRAIHWWVAALVAAQFLGHTAMRSAMERADTSATPTLADFLITTAHTAVGLALLALTLWRFRLRQQNPVPVAGGKLASKLTLLARAWHLSLYLVIVVTATSGALSYYVEIGSATRLHSLCKWVLGTLVIGHMLAGLAHWLLFKDDVLQGMLGNGRDADTMTGSDQSSD